MGSASTTLEKQVEFNRRRIKADGYSMSIGELTSIYERGELDIHPEFQRYFRWNDQQKSDLIESILLGIPLPSIFVSQRDDGVWDVVDGLQRLSTIFQFQAKLKAEDGSLEQPLTLTETTYLPLLKGRRFPAASGSADDAKRSISEALALDFKRSKLDLKIILRSSDPGQEYDLFQRLNTGGTQLSDQEVRNNLLIMAKRNDFRKLKELSSLDAFQSTIAVSDRLSEEQFDIELAIRFLVMYQMPLAEFSGLRDLNKFLNHRMLQFSNENKLLSDKAVVDFRDTFTALDSAFGSNAFRRFNSANDSFTGGFLVSAYEVIALGLGNNIAAWRGIRNATTSIRTKVHSAWDPGKFLARPRMGVAVTARIPDSISEGRRIFKK
ncbi:MAG: GmrSD restriction endonuclease domain-containing protein [Candidatus Dormibacteraceae bacterium]